LEWVPILLALYLRTSLPMKQTTAWRQSSNFEVTCLSLPLKFCKCWQLSMGLCHPRIRVILLTIAALHLTGHSLLLKMWCWLTVGSHLSFFWKMKVMETVLASWRSWYEWGISHSPEAHQNAGHLGKPVKAELGPC
jgi:hypothetical protein